MYVQRHDLQKDKQNQVGFLLGATGVQAVAAVIYASCHNKDQMQANVQGFAKVAKDRILVPSVVHRCGSDELFVGRAGYLSGALWMNSMLNTNVTLPSDLFVICDAIVQSGREYVQRKFNAKKQVLICH